MAAGKGPGPSELKHDSFDLSGGRPCLDLVNTLERRLLEPRDRLGSYEDLVSWAEAAGVVAPTVAGILQKEAGERLDEARLALSAARDLREILFAVFSAVAGGTSLSPAALDALNDALPVALGALQLAATRDGFEWRWSLDRGGLDRVLAPVVRDAAELLTSQEIRRVRVCEAESCAWLFLDQSRNRSRRWCDMSVCGNRAKARRFYERSKDER